MTRRIVGGFATLIFMALFAIGGIGTASAHAASTPTITPPPTTQPPSALRVHVTADVNRVCTSHRNPACVTEHGTFDGTFFVVRFDTYKGSLVADVDMVGKITYKDGSVEIFGRADRLVRVDSITLVPGDKPGVMGDLRITFNSAYLMHQIDHQQDTEDLGFYNASFSVLSIEESYYVNPARLSQVFTAPQVDGKALALNVLLGLGEVH